MREGAKKGASGRWTRVKSMGNIIVGGLIAAAIGGILWKMIRDKKSGKSSCGCGSCGCGCSSCGSTGCGLADVADDLSSKFPGKGE